MRRAIRKFFYDNGEVIVIPILFIFYISLIITPIFPEFVFVDLFLIGAIAIAACSVGVAIAIYDIVYGIALGIASLLDWIFEPKETPDEEPVTRDARDDVTIAIPESNEDTILTNIVCSMIDYTPYSKVLIASDLHPYDATEIQRLDIFNNKRFSPYTREPLLGTPFPYHFVNHTRFLQYPTATNLIRLFTCPVTNEIMTDPVVAHLDYTHEDRSKTPFVLVCDRSALQGNNLPAGIDMIRMVDYDPLAKALQCDTTLGTVLRGEATHLVPKTNFAKGWETAFALSAKDYPSTWASHTFPTPFTYRDAVYTLFGDDNYVAEAGHNNAPAGPRR